MSGLIRFFVKYFKRRRSPEKSAIEAAGLGTGPLYWFSVVNEQQSVTSGFPLSPIGARHKYLLILFPFSYQVYNPASDTRPASLLLNCLRGPVWLSHNKTAPALDAAQTTSLGYEIISRRRSVQTFPRPRPKILTSPCYFRRQLQHTSGIPRELTNEDVVISTSANWSTVIVQHSTSGNISFGCHLYH